MSVIVDVTKKQGSTMGTVIARVTDPGVIVRDVNFYVAVPGRSGELGPFPPDIVRRPSPGVYEKDVVLDPEFQTQVRIEVNTENLGAVTFNGGYLQEFGPRTATAGGTGEVRVKDANTGPTVAETLAIEGATVAVSNGVATFNLDGRYLPLGGGTVAGQLNLSVGKVVLGADANGALELGDSLGSGTPFIDFHKGVGGQQDFNVRFINSGSNYMHVQFAAGTGTFNVAGAIAQGGIPVSLSDHHHDGRYAPATHTHDYLPVAGGTVTGHTSFIGGLNASGIRSTSNAYFGSDGAYLNLTNTAAQFLTSGNGALQGRFGSLVLSSDYLHAQHVPPNGLWVAGGTSLAALTTRGLLTVQGGMRYANGGILQANRTDGGVDDVFWPRWTDNNTYLNYGSGGYFSIRDNAHNPRLTFGPEGAGFTTWVQARGENGYDLRLGGPRHAAQAWISTTPNLHLDSPNGRNIYLNYVSDRPVNVGAIDQNTYKLAVGGDALVTGWFRNSHSGQGLYNEALGRHLYAGWDSHNSGWNITGGAGETFLVLRHTPASAPGGWLFSNADGFGLLHSGRGWAVRSWHGGMMLYGSSLMDEAGNQLAAVKIVTQAPDQGTAARVGTLYVLVA
jgi:hypothetical protein